MTKEQENVSVEEYFEKVREGKVQVLAEKVGGEDDEGECERCTMLLQEIKVLKESLFQVWQGL